MSYRIPMDWKILPLGALINPVTRTETVSQEREYRLIGVRWYAEGAHIHDVLPGSEIKTTSLSRVEENDIIYNKMWASKAAFAVAKRHHHGAYGTAEYPQFRANPHSLCVRFLEYVYHLPRFLYDATTLCRGTTGRARLNPKDFSKIEIPVPPLPEQCKIAEILGTWDKAIALTEQLIAAKQQRKKALMQQLLTGKRRFKEFESKPWRQVRFKDVAVINPPKPKHLPDDTLVSFITMSDVSEEAQVVNATDRPHREVKTGFTSFQDKDILVAKITPCFENGKGALVQDLKNGFGFGSTEFHVIRVDESQANSQFVYYHTTAHNFRGRGEASMVGSAGQKRVRKDFIRSYQFMLPPLQEQCKIAAVLQACDTEINLLRQKLDALQRQKKGLMQQLLTGRTRVKV